MSVYNLKGHRIEFRSPPNDTTVRKGVVREVSICPAQGIGVLRIDEENFYCANIAIDKDLGPDTTPDPIPPAPETGPSTKPPPVRGARPGTVAARLREQMGKGAAAPPEHPVGTTATEADFVQAGEERGPR